MHNSFFQYISNANDIFCTLLSLFFCVFIVYAQVFFVGSTFYFFSTFVLMPNGSACYKANLSLNLNDITAF